MPAAPASNSRRDPPPVRGVRWGFWSVWLVACVVAAVALHALLRKTQAPDACRIGMVVLIPDNPAGVGVMVKVAGDDAERLIAPHFGDHQDARWWNWRITPESSRCTILRVEADKWNQPLELIAQSNAGWTRSAGGDMGGPIETRSGAPILINGFALWQRVVFATGPDEGKVTIDDLATGTRTTLDLRRDEAGELAGAGIAGPRELVLAFDVPRMDEALSFRVATPSGAEGMILRAWSTRGSVLLDAAKRTGQWHPPPPPLIPPPALAAGLVGLALFAWPALVTFRRTRLSPDAGMAMAIVLWSLGYAGLLMLLYSPGIVVPDSTTRVTHVASMWLGIPVPYWITVHWFPPGYSLAMVASHMLSSGQALLALVQAWWLFASIGLLALVVCGRRVAPWVLLVAMLLPSVWTHAVTLLPDAPSAAALCTLAAVLLWARQGGPRLRAWQWGVCIGAWMLAMLTLITFRANAVTTLVVLVPAAWWACAGVSRVRALAWIAWCGACLALAAALPTLIPWKKLDTLAASLVWEHVGMLKLAGDDALTARNSLDVMGRYTNATRIAIAKHDWHTHDSLFWRDGSSLETQLVVSPASGGRARWWALVREEPALYLRTKWEVAKTMLGMHHHIPLSVVVPWEVPWETAYGVDAQPRALLGGVGERVARTPPEPQYLSWNAWTITQWIDMRWRLLLPIYLPYVWIGLAGGLWVACLARGRVRQETTFLLLLAGAAYGAYFVITPGLHWRYFMPACMLLLVAIPALIQHLAERTRAAA